MISIPKTLAWIGAATPIRSPTGYGEGGLAKLIENGLQLVFFGSGLACFVYLVIGAFSYIVSGGEKDKIQKAQQTMTYAVVGLVLVVTVYAVIRIIETVLGIGILTEIVIPKAPGL